MQIKHYNVYFFVIILVGISALAFMVVQPFLIPFIIAAVLANLFGPMYEGLLKIMGKNKVISSALTCFIIVLIIIVPLFTVSFLVINEAQETIIRFSQDVEPGRGVADKIISSISSLPIIKTLGTDIISERTIVDAVKGLSQNALLIFQGAYSGAVHLIFVIFIMFFSLFYLFMDGKDMIKKIIKISPLRDKYEQILIEKFTSISRATLKGTSLIAVIQGTMGGILFWATGVSSPVLLGILMTLASIIPSIGSGLVWFPVGIIMILLGNVASGVAILLVGALVISTVDNIVKPKLVGRDTQIHPLLILLSTLGGIALFGIAGFIIGPIVIALFISLWEIYAIEFRDQLREFNK